MCTVASALNLFARSANAMYWVAIAAIGGTLVATPALCIVWARTPYATGQEDPPPQPVKFDHRHHVRDDGIDCLYCHTGATNSKNAGIPPTATCMACHSQIWTGSPELAPVQKSWFDGAPLHWTRVNNVPDFVFFDHSVHVNKGVGCVECHGRVDLMGQVFAAQPLTMRWCLDCHRDPEKHLRPLDRITDMEWKADDPAKVGHELGKQLGVRSITHCTACHR